MLSPAQAGQKEAEFSAEGKTVDAILNAANQYRTGGEIRKAETVLLAGEKQYPTEVLLNIAAAELMLYDKQLDKAYTHYQKAIVNDPKNAAVLFSAGTVASQLGRTEEAIGHYEAARANDPRDFRFPLFLAQVQVKLERYDEAKKNLLLAVTLNPESAVGWGTLAEIALREGNTGLSLQHIAKSRTIEPDVTLWRLIQARALKRQADPEGALALLIGLSPAQQREPGVLDTMEECLGLLGRIDDAADLFARATEHDVNDGAVRSRRPSGPSVRSAATMPSGTPSVPRIWAPPAGKSSSTGSLAATRPAPLRPEPRVSRQPASAINPDDLPRHVGRFEREPPHDLRSLLRRARSAQGHAAEVLGLLGFLCFVPALGPGHHAGRHAVHAYGGGEVAGERPHHLGERRLAHRVTDEAAPWSAHGVDVAHGDNRTAAGQDRSLQAFPQQSRQQQRGPGVDGVIVEDALGREFFGLQVRRRVDRCVVHQHIESRRRLAERTRERADAAGRREVERDDLAPRAKIRRLCGE